MKIIEITELNYQDYLSLDIVAFSFAYAGAMGEPGAIYIIDRKGMIYHANYCFGNYCLGTDHIKDIIPVFEYFKWGLAGAESNNDDWKTEYLGYGNNLLIHKEIYGGFKKKVEEANFQRSGQLFQQWPGFILSLIGKGNEKLTLNDIRK